MINFDHSILRCPVTGDYLKHLDRAEALEIVDRCDPDFFHGFNISSGFTNAGGTYFYPVFDDIILLLPAYALYTGKGSDIKGEMAFDKVQSF